MRYITEACFALIFLTSPHIVCAEKKNYECANQLVSISFSIKDGSGTDKVSGSIKFKSGYKGIIKGVYEEVTDTFLATADAPNNKKKALTGTYDSDSDIFHISARLSKGVTTDFVCPRKTKKEDLLTGAWVVNDASFFTVNLSEGAGGAITGTGGKGFEGYLIDGVHLSDGSVTIAFISPDGSDDSFYTLKICSSKVSMEGSSSSSLSPETTWCRKALAINSECPPDPSCL